MLVTERHTQSVSNRQTQTVTDTQTMLVTDTCRPTHKVLVTDRQTQT